jgi:hypothetical protein
VSSNPAELNGYFQDLKVLRDFKLSVLSLRFLGSLKNIKLKKIGLRAKFNSTDLRPSNIFPP